VCKRNFGINALCTKNYNNSLKFFTIKMYKFVVFAALLAVVAALDCTNLATGFYCNDDGSYTECVNGYGYVFQCATGTACGCGTGNECDSPCTTACETGTSDARTFCTARLNNFDQEGYFCDEAGDGFYQCVADSFCNSQASPQSSFISCPSGSECRCGDTFEECSSQLSLTPCEFPAQYQPGTTGTTGTTGAPASQGCSGHGFNCQDYSTLTYCTHDTTEGLCVNGILVCFQSIDTNTAVCANAGGCTYCNTASDCGPADEWVCAINTCCGSPTCAPLCNN